MKTYAPAELVLSLLHVLEDAEEAPSRHELVTLYRTTRWEPKTIHEAIRELEKIGAIRITSNVHFTFLTELGRIWLHQDELPPLPQPRRRKNR